MKLFAPAKLNLTLEVLGKRPDGYHEIRSVMQTISLCDEFTFKPADSLEVTSDMPGWEPEKSLVMKAARLFQDYTRSTRGARIEIVKRIPLVSGLGGDSSDAAATLRGLDRIWGLDIPNEDLSRLAARLGSDVPYFLHGGTALAGGRGEKITPLPPVPPLHIVLIMPDIPPVPGKTARLYESLTPDDYTDGSITDAFIKALKSGEDMEAYLYNVFEKVAFARFPELEAYRERISGLGVGEVHLAGSGPTLYLVTRDPVQAKEWRETLQHEGFKACLYATVAD